jgi:chromosome segregation ATPase
MDSHDLELTDSEPSASCSAEALRVLQERAQAAVAARREHITRLETDLNARLEEISAALAQQEATSDDEAEASQAELARLTAEFQKAQEDWRQEREAWDSQRSAWEKQCAEADTAKAAFEADRATWDLERSAWEAEKLELVAAAAKIESERQDSQAAQQNSDEEWRRQLAGLEQALADQRAAAERDVADVKKSLVDLQRDRDELQHKFELALEDVQRFRSRVAELEQELDRRPESTNADSAEVVALRAERDSLAERVKQLEEGQVSVLDTDAEQERADLQRRFEMAVEDVRELKTKNAKLEAQLASSGSRASSSANSDAMDWESQKRRLLASLEGGEEDGAISAEDRASIESTIEITDAVVAEKDAVIAELEAKLAAGAGEVDQAKTEDAVRQAAINQLLDADEVIAEHRKRVALLEQEMEQKLRAAELELSVERANIARTRVELDELRLELESQRQVIGPVGTLPAVGTPKRRWLSKLGLAGDDDA